MNKSKEKLSLRQVGRGFITNKPLPGMLTGRRLTKTYIDQFNRKYVDVNGKYELLTTEHNYLSAD